MKFSAAVVQALTAVLLLVTIAVPATAQQAYPSKPIRFIVPYPPGGTSDPMVRLVGQKLTDSWGQQVIVDNRPGGNTYIGMDALAKSPPDGYTIAFAGSSLALVPLLLPAPFDPIKDLAPIATFGKTEYVLLINPAVPAKNLKELVTHAKSKPGQLNYATNGAGGPQHLAFELLNMEAGIKTQHIPYKGAGPALADLLGGRVQMYLSTIFSAVPHIKSGALRAIAISGDTRAQALPQVPTFIEAGVSGIGSLGLWYGIVAPAGTAKVIIDKMATEIGKYSVMPDFKEKLASLGFDPYFSTPEQFAAIMKADMVKNAKIIKAANIKFEN